MQHHGARGLAGLEGDAPWSALAISDALMLTIEAPYQLVSTSLPAANKCARTVIVQPPFANPDNKVSQGAEAPLKLHIASLPFNDVQSWPSPRQSAGWHYTLEHCRCVRYLVGAGAAVTQQQRHQVQAWICGALTVLALAEVC